MVKNTIISECLALNTEENARAVLSDVRYCLVVEADEFRHELAPEGVRNSDNHLRKSRRQESIESIHLVCVFIIFNEGNIARTIINVSTKYCAIGGAVRWSRSFDDGSKSHSLKTRTNQEGIIIVIILISVRFLLTKVIYSIFNYNFQKKISFWKDMRLKDKDKLKICIIYFYLFLATNCDGIFMSK